MIWGGRPDKIHFGTHQSGGMRQHLPGGLQPRELRNVAGVAAVGILLVWLIAILADPGLLLGYPAAVGLGVVGVAFALAGLTPVALPTVTTAETRLVVVFLFVTAATAGIAVLGATGFALPALAVAAVGLAAGCGGGLSVRRLGIPDHSLLVAVWLLFLSVATVVVLTMGHHLLVTGELATLIVVGFVAAALYLVHATLLSERADQLGSTGP